MVTLNPLKWGRKKETSEFHRNVLQVVAAEHARNQTSLSDEMQKSQDRLGFDMTHDDKVLGAIQEMYELTGDPFWLGEIVRCSHTTPTRYVDPYIAETYKLEEETDDLERECVMPDEHWDSGTHYFVKGLNRFKQLSFDDSKRGRKAIIVKSVTTQLKVGLMSGEKREGEY
jgi:hypothetical protein